MTIEQVHRAIYMIAVPFGGTGTMFSYLIKGERLALVDTGVAESPQTVLRPALAEIGLDLTDVSVILNTHAHLDHSGGNSKVKRTSNAHVHVHEADAPMARSVEAEVEFHTQPLRVLGFPPEVIADRAAHVRDNAGEPAGADIALSDGDTIDLGARIGLRAVHCPGNTPGSVAYWWEEEDILLTGDGIQGQGSRPGGYPLYHDASNYRRSLKQLMSLNCRTLCLGHAYLGGTLLNHPVRRGSEVHMFIQAAITTADTIHKAVTDAMRKRSHASKREIAFAALDELLYEIPQLRLRRTGMPVLAGPTLLAHIESALGGTYPS